MYNAITRLQSLRVSDVMAKPVVYLSPQQSMVEAAEIFIHYEISAAPVVDAEGRCVGILSATDFLKREGAPERSRHGELGRNEYALLDEGPEEAFPSGPRREEQVGFHMTWAVQSIGPRSSLVQAGRIMSAEHVHRLPVLDAEGRPVGMISTMDIVAAVVNAMDEMAALSSTERLYEQ